MNKVMQWDQYIECPNVHAPKEENSEPSDDVPECDDDMNKSNVNKLNTLDSIILKITAYASQHSKSFVDLCDDVDFLSMIECEDYEDDIDLVDVDRHFFGDYGAHYRGDYLWPNSGDEIEGDTRSWIVARSFLFSFDVFY